jgi:glycosyltransferase involved in cell wall biosynthesis
MVCPVYTMLARDGICERCGNGRFHQCLLKQCAKGSFFRSLVSTVEMYLHRQLLHTDRIVDLFISPSQFLRDKLVEMGFRGTIRHLPNSIDVSRYSPAYTSDEKSIVYFGRLSAEKGLLTLIDAVDGLPLTCKIIGEGPLRYTLEEQTRQRGIKNLLFLGYMDHEDLRRELSGSMFVVAPSEWYENNPLSVIEAFACGKPVVGARIGGIPELVEHQRSGLLFSPGDVDGLREALMQLLANPDRISDYGRNARARVEEYFSRKRYAEGLLGIYHEAIRKHEAS